MPIPTYPHRTPYGIVFVSMSDPDSIYIDTIDRTNDCANHPITVNGVKYMVRLSYKREHYTSGWRLITTSISRQGDATVSDSARWKIYDAAEQAIAHFDTEDYRNVSAYYASKSAVYRAEAVIADLRRKMEEALNDRLVAHDDLHAAYQRVVVVRPRHPMNNEGLVCGSCGADAFINHPRTLDSYDFECVGCGRHYHPLTETGASR